MKQTINQLKNSPGFIPFIFLLTMIFTSISFAQDFESGDDQDFFVSANIFSISANKDFDLMSISYNGISSNREAFDVKQPLGQINLENFQNDGSFDFGRKLKQITNIFFRYVDVDDFSSDDDIDSKFQLKSKVNTHKTNTKDVEFNLSLLLGSDDVSIVKMGAIKLESVWMSTHLNAIYHYEKSELELNLSSDIINNHLLDGMQLELQANPSAGSGAILLIKRW